MILTSSLRRYFGTTKAVDGVSLNIDEGEFFGLLGANGAGKTTIVRMLATLLPQTSGTIEINGLSVPKQSELVRHYIGYVPQALSSDGTLTGYENLLIFCRAGRPAQAKKGRKDPRHACPNGLRKCFQ
jgi:ABC-2 type transport system ATP-binding protein